MFNEPAYRRELAEPLPGAPCVVVETLHRSRPWFRLKPAAWLTKPCRFASASSRRGATRGAIFRFRRSPCIHMKDALQNKAYKQKGLADAVDAGKALRCVQLRDMGEAAYSLYIIPVQMLELAIERAAAAAAFLRVVQRVVGILVNVVTVVGAIGERCTRAQRHLRHAVYRLR